MLSTLLLSSILSAAVPVAQAPQNAPQSPDAIYTARCATCHEAGVARAPNRDGLTRLTPDSIRQTLTSGSMSTQAAGLTPPQIDSLARLLGRAAAPTAGNASACTSGGTSLALDG